MIRPAETRDCARLSQLAQRSKAHWGYGPAFMEACRSELTIDEADLACDTIFVLEDADNAEIVGFYSLERLDPARVELSHLFVDPDAIGQGLGARLMAHAIDAARGLGFDTLEIQADPNAEDFYARCGAHTVGSRASASIEGRSLPLMELPL